MIYNTRCIKSWESEALLKKLNYLICLSYGIQYPEFKAKDIKKKKQITKEREVCIGRK